MDSLLTLLEKILALPEYLHRNAIKDTFAEWATKSPLVEEVVSGRKTFEEAIMPLIEENRKLRYLSYRKGFYQEPTFETVAKKAITDFDGILPSLHGLPYSLNKDKRNLTFLNFIMWVIGTMIALSATLLFLVSSSVLIVDNWRPLISIAMFCSLVANIPRTMQERVLTKKFVQWRQESANERLKEVKFLDAIVQENVLS
jgi:hypothetical protein